MLKDRFQPRRQIPMSIKKEAVSNRPAKTESRGENSFGLESIPPLVILGGAALLAVFLWSFWPTWVHLVHKWDSEPDYSHGYLVVPLALFALKLRMDTFPHNALRVCWYGLLIIAFAIALRTAAGLFYIDGVEGWAMVVWIAGACLLLGGWKFFRWSLPAVAFLVFMIPLPFQVERAMRLPLQKIATNVSCWMLQSLGQPALAEGNTILLGEHPLEVEEACSGLRIFVAIAVLAFAYMMIVRPTWWERIVLVLCIVPIALISNALRIVITGLLLQYISGDWARTFSHDLAGWMMIPLAAAMFFCVLWYLGKLMKEVEVVNMQELLHSKPV